MRLRDRLEAGAASATVLAPRLDPYRLDTPANHKVGKWLAEQLKATGRDQIHLRGLHYVVISADGGVGKPNGKRYLNTDEDWQWLLQVAGAARWLGYVPWEAILDRRTNFAPVLFSVQQDLASGGLPPWVQVVGDYAVPDADELQIGISDERPMPRQPFHLVLWAEKASAEDILRPIAQEVGADLYLAQGEWSATQIAELARRNVAHDRRPLRVFMLADFDPAGHQMPVSASRKFQALRDLQFPDLDWEVHVIGLTVEQVREFGLPSSPLKATERRGDRWRAAHGGLEQTEIDALLTLHPPEASRIVREKLAPFWDPSLASRQREAVAEWQSHVAEAVGYFEAGDPKIASLRRLAKVQAEDLRSTWDQLTDRLQAVGEELADDIDPFPKVEPHVRPEDGAPFVSSDWQWETQTAVMRARKAYDGEIDDAA